MSPAHRPGKTSPHLAGPFDPGAALHAQKLLGPPASLAAQRGGGCEICDEIIWYLPKYHAQLGMKSKIDYVC